MDRKLQGCFKKVLESFKGVFREFQRSSQDDSRKF